MEVVIEKTTWADILLIRTLFNRVDNRIIDIPEHLFKRYQQSMDDFNSVQTEIKRAMEDIRYSK